MRLYHGTAGRHLDNILKNGIQPRGENESVWEAASHKDAVYLTKAYALYFASNARLTKDEDLLIVEVDTDLLPAPKALVADEDALTFAWLSGALKPFEGEASLRQVSMNEQAHYFSGHLRPYAAAGFDADWSLRFLGNCTYLGVIPPEAITRIVSYEGNSGWWFSFHDPSISPANFRFCGSDYVASQLVLAGRLDEAKAVEHLLPTMQDASWVEQLCSQHRGRVIEMGQAAVTPAVSKI